MTRPEATRDPGRGLAHAFLGGALLAVTAFVRVPTQLYDASRQDFSEASSEVLLILFGSGLLVFLVLSFAVAWLPPRLRSLAGAALVGLGCYGWIRASFFPGPSVNLDGRRLTADLSTGVAGLLIPVATALLLALLGRRQPRIVTTLLGVLLGGSLVQSAVATVSIWRGGTGASQTAAAAILEWSREGNVLILILDTLQADVLEDVLAAEPRLREDLDGFRFYRRASSNSPTTYLSLPAIHSGRPHDPARSARQFFLEAIQRDSVLNRLADAGYRVSYAMNLRPCPEKVTECLSTAVLGRSRKVVAFREAMHLLDLGIYRVLPDRPRRAILEQGRGLLGATAGEAFLVDRAEAELAALERLASSLAVTDSPRTAKMVHTMITHPPLVLQPDCSRDGRSFERPGAVAQARCAFRPIVALFERLKAEQIYDSSDILLIADHGYGFESAAAAGTRDAKFRRMLGAFNPTVLVKPAGERGPLVTSDAPIELADLAAALCDETGCSPSEGLRGLPNVNGARNRRLFWYSWKHGYWSLPRIPGVIEYTVRGDLTKAGSWSRDAVAYTPGTLLDFRRGRQNSSAYLGFGWGLRRPAYQEMVDPRATLSLRAPFNPNGVYEMALQARLYHSSPTVPARVEVRVNDVTVGDLVSEHPDSAPKVYRLQIPGADLARTPDTTITFSAVSPSGDQGPGETLALQTFVLRPLPAAGSASNAPTPPTP